MPTISFRVSRPEVDIRQDPDGRWRVTCIVAKGGGKVKWNCPNCDICILFPEGRTPLAGGATQVSGRSPLSADIDKNASGYYIYCAIVKGRNGVVHSVEGGSPPEMVIE